MKNRYTALVLIVINIIIFILQNFFDITNQYALVSSDVLARPWILVTSMFLHGSATHLLGNIFALGVFGLLLEQFIGTKRFLVIYFASGIVSGVAASFFYTSAIGASGAIFGILGALAVIRPRMYVWTYGIPMPMIVATFFWLFLDILGAFYPSNTANIAHIAGLIFGAAIAFLFLEKESRREKREKVLGDEEFRKWEKEWM